jgi:acyl-CoA thioesterase-1
LIIPLTVKSLVVLANGFATFYQAIKNMKQIALNFCIALAAIAFSSQTEAAEPIKVVCIGDSITYGARVKDREKNAYPAQLQDLLGPTHKVSNCGTSGIQMQNYLNRWADKITAIQPDIVTIKLGTNDTKSRDFTNPDNKEVFDKNYRDASLKLLDFLDGLKSKPKIYLCYPVPVFKPMGKINEKSIVEDIIPGLTAIAKEKNLPIIDLYKALAGKNNLVPDGVHPGAEGQTVLAKTIATALQEPQPEKKQRATLYDFRNSDGTKSFKARLKSFDPATGKITAIKANGSLTSFNIDFLHPDDQKYVKEQK